MNVLIVEDNDVAQVMLQAALSQAGFTVETVTDGAAALERILDGGPRLVISDWEMPGMTGVELCRAVREADIGGYVYFILVTSHNKPTERVAGLSAGADDFIAKPYNPAELVERVRAGERILSLETREVAIFAMAKLAESRDPETGAHLERVRSYSRVLAQHMAGVEKYRSAIDAEFIRLIYLTSPLHDIGKVGIPDSVLLKPGRLSDREFEIMKTHATIGSDTLRAALRTFPNVKFLQMASDIAASHHEHWDGSGYPARLAGENIPLAGRIVALADVYDALSSKRVYKAAYSHEVAKDVIVKDRGRHFDPDIVDAFLASEERFLQIRAQFAEMSMAMAA